MVRLKSGNDVKLYILCLMDYIGYPLDFVTINDMVVQDEFVRHFDFIENFNELLEKKFVEKVGEDLYRVTEEGSFIAETLKSDIEGYIRTQGMRSAMRLVSFQKSGVVAKAGKRKREDGQYDLVCRILKRQKEILNVTVNVETEFQCDRMIENFNNNPERLYKVVWAALSDEIAPLD